MFPFTGNYSPPWVLSIILAITSTSTGTADESSEVHSAGARYCYVPQGTVLSARAALTFPLGTILSPSADVLWWGSADAPFCSAHQHRQYLARSLQGGKETLVN
jgi:hypothetical protein